VAERVIVFDTTLRDGEQAPGINLNAKAKVEIAEQLARLGVDVIEAGFPQASHGDFEAVRAVAERIKGATVAALARTAPGDVDRAAEALAPAQRGRLHTFIATSPIHMRHKLRMSPAEVLAAAEGAVARAKGYTDDVEFSAEDATRSDAEFLKQVYAAAIAAGATTCSMEEVVMALRTHQASLGVATGVNTREIARTSRLVSLLTGYPIQPNKAIVGANAFAHESGIHQHGVLMERTTYEHMDPRELGFAGSRIVLGKHSGRHAVADALHKLGFDLDREELDKAFLRFKELADRKPRITDVDLEALVAGEVLADEAAYRFVGLQVAGGTVMSPTATVRLSHDQGVVEESAVGDGMVDAACAAIAKAVKVDAKLVEFHVAAVGGGTDALGDVTVQVEHGGTRVTGRGVATDVVEASARAYLQAVNRLVRGTPGADREEVPA
jgi:2-isopropylmalate synthase